jgi:hypothetical protein
MLRELIRISSEFLECEYTSQWIRHGTILEKDFAGLVFSCVTPSVKTLYLLQQVTNTGI